jgi:hypothetical protein
VSKGYVTWKSPKNLKEENNFTIKVAEIKSINFEKTISPDGPDVDFYYMELTNFPKYTLYTRRSGIAILYLFNMIARLGVPYHYSEKNMYASKKQANKGEAAIVNTSHDLS